MLRSLHPRASALVVLLCLACGACLAPAPAHAATGNEGGAIATDSHLGRVYMTQPGSDHVFVLSMDGAHLIDVLRVPASPTALAVDARHALLYVASDPAGVITRFDTRRDLATGAYRVAGHPSGLAIVNNGHTLLVSDAVAGTLQAVAVGNPWATGVRNVGPLSVQGRFVVGPDVSPYVLLAPQRGWSGSSSLIWARGFTPGEPIDVSWGIRPLAAFKADASGQVSGRITVPAHTDLGDHLLILQGEWSKRAQSGLLTVVKAPPPPKRPRRLKPTVRVTPWEAILRPSVTLAVPPELWRLFNSAPSTATKAATRAEHHGSAAPTAAHHGGAAATGSPPAAKAKGLWGLLPLPLHFTPQRVVRIPLVVFALPFLILLIYLTRFTLRARRTRAARKAARAAAAAAKNARKSRKTSTSGTKRAAPTSAGR